MNAFSNCDKAKGKWSYARMEISQQTYVSMFTYLHYMSRLTQNLSSRSLSARIQGTLTEFRNFSAHYQQKRDRCWSSNLFIIIIVVVVLLFNDVVAVIDVVVCWCCWKAYRIIWGCCCGWGMWNLPRTSASNAIESVISISYLCVRAHDYVYYIHIFVYVYWADRVVRFLKL